MRVSAVVFKGAVLCLEPTHHTSCPDDDRLNLFFLTPHDNAGTSYLARRYSSCCTSIHC
jgi:hypothetical protein